MGTDARKIVTRHEFPPIPDRRFDWIAFYEGEEEAGDYGTGATEAEAVQDFIENYQEGHDERLGPYGTAAMRAFGLAAGWIK